MKAQFLTKIRLEDIDGGHMALFTPLKFYSHVCGNRIVAVLPGFITDFASIPRGLWNVFPKNGPWDGAAILHDAAYRKQLRDRDLRPFLLDKATADKLFLEAMTVSGVGRVRRRLMYLAVKWFGKGQFDSAQPQEAA